MSKTSILENLQDSTVKEEKKQQMDITQESEAPKAKVMLWTDVSYHAMEELDKLQSTPDLERGVLLELYVQTVLFCREHSFKKEQTSALLSIMKSIHEANVAIPLNIEQCYKYCSELLLCHSVRRPPFSMSLFSSEEVAHVLEYIHNSYMRHYKLYKYIFTPQRKLDLSLTYIGIPDEDEQTLEDSVVPADDQKMLGEEADARSSATPDSKSGLQGLIQQEVREQMMIISGQLEERMKDNQGTKK